MSLEKFQKIDDYLSGKLSESESVSFECELQNNDQLQKEVKLQETVNDVVLEGRMLDVRSKLNSIHLGQTHVLGKMSTAKVSIISFISAAVIGTGAWFLLPSEQIDHSKIRVDQNLESTPKAIRKSPEIKVVGVIEEIEVSKEIEESINKEIVSKSQHVESREVIPTKAQPKEVVIDVCKSVEIGTELEIIPTCIGAKRGGVFVNYEKTNGGLAPYSYSMDGDNFQTEGKFIHLASGKYSFYIKDQNDCIVKKTDWVRIQSTSCK